MGLDECIVEVAWISRIFHRWLTLVTATPPSQPSLIDNHLQHMNGGITVRVACLVS
jgi:hypothetical protein